MSVFRHVARFLDFDPNPYDGDADHISSALRRDIVRHEDTRGVEWTTWKAPKVGCANSHLIQRGQLRIVGKRAG